MSDIVETLRGVTESDAYETPWTFRCHCLAAADEIERLRALEETLRDIVYSADNGRTLHCGFYTAKEYRFTTDEIERLKGLLNTQSREQS